MVRKTSKSEDEIDLSEDQSHKEKRSDSESKAVVKLIVMLAIVGVAVTAGAIYHQKQSQEPLGYEYFKKRGYDKINTLDSETPPEEDAKTKAQRNIFLQD